MIAARRPAARLGRYELGEIIGTGGVAQAWLAHLDGIAGFRKRVVIKRLRPELRAHTELHAAFVREARIAQALHHANIVQVLDLGDDDGVPYLVLEHVDGCSLDVLLAQGVLPPAIAVHVAEQVALALHHVHAAEDEHGVPLGLVHRDVTPGNVLLSRDGAVKLGDFGIARVAAGGSDTLPGLVTGTPLYIAPEQAAGRPVDARADIFSLGLVLRRMLVADGGLAEVDARLAAIIESATEPSARDRLPDADSLLRRLQQLGSGEDATQALATAVRRAIGRARTRAVAIDDALASAAPHTRRLAAPPPVRPRRSAWAIAVVLAAAGVAALSWPAAEPTSEAVATWSERLAAPAPRPSPSPVPAALPRAQPADPELVVPDATPTKPARSARGRLRVNVIPWADVRVDGKPFGRAPVDRALPAGRHEVELYNPDIPRRAEHHVVIAADRPFEITRW